MEIKLSVVIITYNEERNIERCLRSVQTVADEIVVVDSFSTDATQKICERFDVRFIEHRFDGHIEQKNWAIEQARYPHILSLDADEALDSHLIESIKEVKANWEMDGYSMNRLNNYCGKWIKHGSWYPDRKLRLVDSRKGRWAGENPHDRFEMDDGATIKRLKGNILHYSYYSISEHVAQSNKFSEIAAIAKFKRGKKASIANLVFNPVAAFLKCYFFKAGFLDGLSGFIIAILSAESTFLKYAKLRILRSENQGE